jgi:hypothetical protein
VGNLFHFKRESGESYHKPVNPWGFADHFNRHVKVDPAFHSLFKGRRLLVEGEAMLKAETQPLPDHVPIEEKSPRIVSLQLIKRNRDIVWRQAARRNLRKPPAIVLASIALEAGPVAPNLVDETVAIANAIRGRLQDRSSERSTVEVLNPAYPPDVFTDRWPENFDAQVVFDGDLRRLIVQLHRLRNDNLSLNEKKELLEGLFGETAASYAIESHLDARRREMEASRMQIGSKGKVSTALGASAAAAAPRTTAARPATREGGGYLSE